MPTIEEMLSQYETAPPTTEEEPVALDPDADDKSAEDMLKDYEERTLFGSIQEGVVDRPKEFGAGVAQMLKDMAGMAYGFGDWMVKASPIPSLRSNNNATR